MNLLLVSCCLLFSVIVKAQLTEICGVGQCANGTGPCTANDVPLTQVVACVGGPNDCNVTKTINCTAGEQAQFYLKLIMKGNAIRYDVGIVLGVNGTSARTVTGNCCRYIFGPTTGTYWKADKDNDFCGDVNKSATVIRYVNTTLLCNANNGSNLLSLPYCITWNQNFGADCFSVTGLNPGTGSKCDCGYVNVSNVVVVVAKLSLALGAVPSCYSGSSVDIPFNITNGPTAVNGITITSSAGGTILCCSTPSCTPTSTFITNLAANAKLTCIDRVTSGSNSFTDTITVSGTDPRDSSSVTATVTTATITKIAASISQTVSADGTSWTLTITNTGGATITPSITNTAALGYTCDKLTLAPGETTTCTASLTVSGTTCSVSNTVTVTASSTGCPAVVLSETDSVQLDRICRPHVKTSPPNCIADARCANGVCPASPINETICNDELLDDGLACTSPKCDANRECYHKSNDNACTACSCLDAKCAPAGVPAADLWDDGCQHKYNNVVINPQSGNCQPVV